MHVTDIIAKAKTTLLSFEILPPLLGRSTIEDLFFFVEKLCIMNPAFISITYHSKQKIVAGTISSYPTPVKKRPGTIGICAAVKTRFGIDTVPHLICTDNSISEIEDKLIELSYLGIDNILALRGDMTPKEIDPYKNPVHTYAVDLVSQISNMNKGFYIDHKSDVGKETNFCIGVAGYPEKHQDSVSYSYDLQYLKQKVDKGAAYIISQMFFDNKFYFRFVEDCRKLGIGVPIIPGIKNLTKKSQLEDIQKKYAVSIPKELLYNFSRAKNSQEEAEIGRNWCICQSRELKQKGVSVIHYYTMGKSEELQKIIKEVF